MGWGVLEPKDGVHVNGTVLLDQAAAHSEGTTSNLKHGTGKSSNIILNPQPSEDPNDPLNWSKVERIAIIAIIGLGATVNASALGPLLAAGTFEIAGELGVTLTDIALLSGYYLLVTGAIGPLVSALARKFGKRPVYVISSLFAVIGCIIGETAKSYNQLLAARCVQGLSTSAYESIVLASVGDLFFVHERGTYVSFINFILAAISNFIAIIAGVITTNLGWPFNFHILMPFVGLQFLLVLFFVPETTYRRAHIYDLDTQGAEGNEKNLEKLGQVEARAERHRVAAEGDGSSDKEGGQLQHQVSAYTMPPARKSFVKRLSLYNGVFVQDNILKMFFSVFLYFGNIAISYNVLVSGIIIAWYVGISILSSIMLSAPPYLFTAAQVGYTSVGPFIGGLLASLYAGSTIDAVAKYMARKAGGVYEPEYKLPLNMAIGCVCAVAGLAGFGHAIQDGKSIYLVCFLWGLLLFGMTLIAIATTGYALDAFRQHATEAFILNMFFKNFFFYGLANYVVDWWVQMGAAKVFDICAGITAFLCLTTVPMYIYGKRYRAYWQRNNIVQKLKFETDHFGMEEAG